LVGATLSVAVSRLDSLRANKAPIEAYEDISLRILLNNAKVLSSEHCFAVADELLQCLGLFGGYLENVPSGAARVFRDLRSSALMFNNDRLIEITGSLALVEGPSLDEILSIDSNVKDGLTKCDTARF